MGRPRRPEMVTMDCEQLPAAIPVTGRLADAAAVGELCLEELQAYHDAGLLTALQYVCVRAWADGLSYRQIGTRLNVHHERVREHVQSALRSIRSCPDAGVLTVLLETFGEAR